MDRLGYTAMTAASRTMSALGVRANNLANVNTPGFRADLEQSTHVPVQGEGYDSRHMAQIQSNGVSLESGALMATGRELDFAIQGKGLIAIQSETGEAYTRHGAMKVDADRQLTVNGRVVLGEGGPIIVPEYDQLHIGADGVISILPQGETVMAEVERIKLVDLPAAQLKKDRDGLLVTLDGLPANVNEAVVLASGFLESSNASAIDQMVGTMSLSRLFETQVKMMKAAEDLSDAGNRMIRGS